MRWMLHYCCTLQLPTPSQSLKWGDGQKTNQIRWVEVSKVVRMLLSSIMSFPRQLQNPRIPHLCRVSFLSLSHQWLGFFAFRRSPSLEAGEELGWVDMGWSSCGGNTLGYRKLWSLCLSDLISKGIQSSVAGWCAMPKTSHDSNVWLCNFKSFAPCSFWSSLESRALSART